MKANDDPAEVLRAHGWQQDAKGYWSLARPDGVVDLCDLDGNTPLSLFEPCMAGTSDGGPVAFPTVEGALWWIERHTGDELRARAGTEVRAWKVR